MNKVGIFILSLKTSGFWDPELLGENFHAHTYLRLLGRVPISRAWITTTKSPLRTNPRDRSVVLKPCSWAIERINGVRILDPSKSVREYGSGSCSEESGNA